MRIHFDSLVSLLVPPRCMVCEGSCEAAEPVCAACRSGLELAARGRPRRLPDSQLDSLSAAYEFGGVARAAVHSLKYGGRVALAEFMAARLLNRSQCSIDPANTAIVPVPTHPANRRSRGFDQAALLARALAGATGAPAIECLARRGLRGTQTGLSRAQRLALPLDEFCVRESARRQLDRDSLADFPTNVVVCDDVATTTCTLEACASAIRERYEVRTIHGLTFASASAT